MTGAVGIEVALAILVGYYGGLYLDAKLGTSPWLQWILLVAGIGAAIKALTRAVRLYQRQVAEEDRNNPANPPPPETPSEANAQAKPPQKPQDKPDDGKNPHGT